MEISALGPIQVFIDCTSVLATTTWTRRNTYWGSSRSYERTFWGENDEGVDLVLKEVERIVRKLER